MTKFNSHLFFNPVSKNLLDPPHLFFQPPNYKISRPPNSILTIRSLGFSHNSKGQTLAHTVAQEQRNFLSVYNRTGNPETHASHGMEGGGVQRRRKPIAALLKMLHDG